MKNMKSHLLWSLVFCVAMCANSTPRDDGQALAAKDFRILGLVYENELAALGERAVFPICMTTPHEVPEDAVIEYLRSNNYRVSPRKICAPSLDTGDFPHGLRIDVMHIVYLPDGSLRADVSSNDNAIHYGVHLAESLRKGTYTFARDTGDKWRVSQYTKLFDYQDSQSTKLCKPVSHAKKVTRH